MVTDDNAHPDGEAQLPSKSQRKRDALAIKALGQRLVDLSDGQLDRLPLDDRQRVAISEAQRMRRGGALKRQIQYIAKLLRDTDTGPLEAALAQMEGHSRESAQRFHKLERWREGLINGDRTILDELFDQHARVDRQQLNHLVRRAQQERSREGDEVAHSRKLFRFLRDLEESGDAEEG